jgi:hypothetical protein
MGLNYDMDSMRKKHADQNYFNRLERVAGGEYPHCHGFYEDCPEKPSMLESKCRNCPQADNVTKPRLEWVDCEHCKEEGVPIIEGTKKEEIEETKCHCCGKINSKDYIISKDD